MAEFRAGPGGARLHWRRSCMPRSFRHPRWHVAGSFGSRFGFIHVHCRCELRLTGICGANSLAATSIGALSVLLRWPSGSGSPHCLLPGSRRAVSVSRPSPCSWPRQIVHHCVFRCSHVFSRNEAWSARRSAARLASAHRRRAFLAAGWRGGGDRGKPATVGIVLRYVARIDALGDSVLSSAVHLSVGLVRWHAAGHLSSGTL